MSTGMLCALVLGQQCVSGLGEPGAFLHIWRDAARWQAPAAGPGLGAPPVLQTCQAGRSAQQAAFVAHKSLTNPCLLVALGTVDCTALTSGALLGLLAWLGVKVEWEAAALLLGLGSALAARMLLPVVCHRH